MPHGKCCRTKLPDGHPLAGCEPLIDQLIDCGRLFHSRGWSVGTSSNYSAVIGREPLELVVTASGEDKGRLKRPDFVRVDQSGKATTSDQPRSSAETMLHVVLAELPGTGAVLHTHSVWGTLLSDHYHQQQGFRIAGYEMLKGLEGISTHDTEIHIPVFENTQDIPELAERVRSSLHQDPPGISHGFLIRNHGLYTWGPDIAAARRQVEVLEFLFEVLGRKTDWRS